MSRKYTKRKKKKSKLPQILGIIAAMLVVLLVVLLLQLPEQEKADVTAEISTETAPVIQEATVKIQETEALKLSLDNDLEILDVGSYTGAYVEDGTDEIVSGILMLKVINNGENAVEYAKLSMKAGEDTAEFTVSTLNPGDTIVLLEKNRMAYDKNVDYTAANVICDNLALFNEPLNCHADQIAIQILDGAINVSNISREDIPGKISIYYKNTAAGVYYGGITYRVTLESGLKAGEIRQMMATHFSDTGSKIMFVTISQ